MQNQSFFLIGRFDLCPAEEENGLRYFDRGFNGKQTKEKQRRNE